MNDLPGDGSINVVREHPRNEAVLLVGTEHGVHVSVDGGGRWYPLGAELPTTPVHDLLVHPREMDVVIGTHGNGIWILDGTMLEDLSADVLASPVHVFPPRDGHQTTNEFRAIRYPAAMGWTGRPRQPDSGVPLLPAQRHRRIASWSACWT